MGTPKYARDILYRLIEDIDIDVSLVITQPDRSVGRKKELKPSEVKVLAKERKLDIIQPETLKDKIFIIKILSFNSQIFIISLQLLGADFFPKKIYLDICSHGYNFTRLSYFQNIEVAKSSSRSQSLNGIIDIPGVTAMLMDEG